MDNGQYGLTLPFSRKLERSKENLNAYTYTYSIQKYGDTFENIKRRSNVDTRSAYTVHVIVYTEHRIRYTCRERRKFMNFICP